MASPNYNLDDPKQWWNVPLEQGEAIQQEWAALTRAKSTIDRQLNQALMMKQLRDQWSGNNLPSKIAGAILTPADKQIEEWQNQIQYIDRKMRTMVTEMPWVIDPNVKSNSWETAMRSWADAEIKRGADAGQVTRDMETALSRLYGESAVPGSQGTGDASAGSGGTGPYDPTGGTLPETYFGMTQRDWNALTPQQQAARVNDYLGLTPDQDSWAKDTWQRQFDAGQEQTQYNRSQDAADRKTAKEQETFARQQTSYQNLLGMADRNESTRQFNTELGWGKEKFAKQLGWDKESFWASMGWDKEKFAKQLGWDREKFEKEMGWDREKFDRELAYKREEMYAQLQQRERQAAMEVGQNVLGMQQDAWKSGLGLTLPKGTTSPPGFEAGGPMEQLYKMGGSTSYSPIQITPCNPMSLEAMLGTIGKAISQFGSVPGTAKKA